MINPQQIVLMANKRICPYCNKEVWVWIKDQDQVLNERCSCDSLYVQRSIQEYKDEEWKEDEVDITPYI